MRTPQVVSGALAVAILAAAGCSRAEADRTTREAAVEVRHAAGEAGERLTDGWLTTKVQAQFFADRDIKARYVDVSTRDGVVTIAGYVDTLAARDQALQIARNTDGVRGVTDELKIGVSPAVPVATSGSNEYDAAVSASNAASAPSAPAATASDRVISMVQARFFLDPAIKARDIDVSASNGVITLRGGVANETERAQALLIARHTNGVGRVEDLLSIDANLK